MKKEKIKKMKRHLLTSADVAKMFDVTRATVNLWNRKGILKGGRTLGGQARYHKKDIQKLGKELAVLSDK